MPSRLSTIILLKAFHMISRLERPFRLEEATENTMDTPTMKRNNGKITSSKVNPCQGMCLNWAVSQPSDSQFMASIKLEIRCVPPIIRNISKPRSASSDSSHLDSMLSDEVEFVVRADSCKDWN